MLTINHKQDTQKSQHNLSNLESDISLESGPRTDRYKWRDKGSPYTNGFMRAEQVALNFHQLYSKTSHA